MMFWLGTHMPNWLGTAGVPLMVSRRRLHLRKTFPQAISPWVLDSGGFTELTMFGEWTINAGRYAAEVRRFNDNVGLLEWAAPQDWMCEPFVLAKTGKTVAQHQALTVRNYLDLSTLWPDGPFIPVLQGQTEDDYLRHVDAYGAVGIDLTKQKIVGLGSVCRRQGSAEIGDIVDRLHSLGLRLHGFGCKTRAVQLYGSKLASADSLAWSYRGRHVRPCPNGPGSCASCLHFALAWRERVITRPEQLILGDAA